MIDHAKCCQWIIGPVSPGREPLFCGEPTVPGKSWCLTHYCKVYRCGYIPLGKKEEVNDGDD
jgi:hypothetical protein